MPRLLTLWLDETNDIDTAASINTVNLMRACHRSCNRCVGSADHEEEHQRHPHIPILRGPVADIVATLSRQEQGYRRVVGPAGGAHLHDVASADDLVAVESRGGTFCCAA